MRFIQPHKGAKLFQKIQEMEVHENVEENNKNAKQNEGNCKTKGLTLHSSSYIQNTFTSTLKLLLRNGKSKIY